MANDYVASVTGRITQKRAKKSKKTLPGGLDDPQNNVSLAPKSPLKRTGVAVDTIKGAVYTGTVKRKLGGQYRGMETVDQKNYQKGNKVYHVWEDAQGRHVRAFTRKNKPRTYK